MNIFENHTLSMSFFFFFYTFLEKKKKKKKNRRAKKFKILKIFSTGLT
jgi:hypothetical protein